MTKMKKYVRILKAPYRSIWYANQIGSIFHSLGAWENAYKVNSPDRALYIRQEDAELIVTEKRPAKRHDRILITNAAMHGLYKNGDEFVVDMEYTFGNGVSVYAEYDIHRLWGYYVTYSEYEVIVNNEVKNGEDNLMKNKLLIDNAKTVFEKKGDKYIGYKSRLGDIAIGGTYSYQFVVHYAKTNEDVVIIPSDANTVTTPVCTTEEERLWKPEKTAQERRDEIVEQAKADVEKLSNRHQRRQYCGYSVEFRVNNEKRTIVVLLKGVNTGIVYTRGIAKAAPDDCFNEHIGKAIALHRALGLEVPDEYLNAPQPTEVRVGDVVMHTATSEIAPVISDDDWPPLTGAYVYQRDVEAARRYALIIDDSRTEAI
ncbi:hypothetical protein [Bacillus paralicheniformis]|uniref:hypothetical protein n=1 Tax=Bacillus paralicheniformis TaxID=1648923 RepID=UPI0021D0E0C1|nr:hypothetical protein [Bacillus paralicheniformis]MCU4668508.1 hypothetical protein [Bacillus paralicheniformis]